MARSDAEYMTASIIPLLKNLLFLSLAYTLASIYDGIWGNESLLYGVYTSLLKITKIQKFYPTPQVQLREQRLHPPLYRLA